MADLGDETAAGCSEEKSSLAAPPVPSFRAKLEDVSDAVIEYLLGSYCAVSDIARFSRTCRRFARLVGLPDRESSLWPRVASRYLRVPVRLLASASRDDLESLRRSCGCPACAAPPGGTQRASAETPSCGGATPVSSAEANLGASLDDGDSESSNGDGDDGHDDDYDGDRGHDGGDVRVRVTFSSDSENGSGSESDDGDEDVVAEGGRATPDCGTKGGWGCGLWELLGGHEARDLVREFVTLPRKPRAASMMHCDEVLWAEFSPCGTYLATASRDRMLFLFKTESIVNACNSSGVSQGGVHQEGALVNPCSVWRAGFDNAKVSWSSDSKFLVVDEATNHGTYVRQTSSSVVFEVSDGALIHKAILPGGHFYSYAWWIDAGVVVYRTSPSQVVIKDLIHNTSHSATFKLPPMVSLLTLPVPQNQGTYRSVIATLSGRSMFSDVWFYKLNEDRSKYEICWKARHYPSVIVGYHISPCGKYMITATRLDTAQDQVHVYLWSLEHRAVVRLYESHGLATISPFTSTFILMPCFVNKGLRYIALPDEEGNLRLWNTFSGSLVCQAKAHTNLISLVASHPTVCLMVTVSDDMKVQFWM
ncbi:hypothetical protein Pelo_5257 [Pelomyxa schiedti]|nr:hypothetical protein Pelo_5257 [Pelomyxa schiedti]